ncbi:hypothetical protein JCM10207_003686 [Rhodosporidiobolus poonsookiae]
MAIFSSSRKDKHKKNGGHDGSASGASSAGAGSPPVGPGQGSFPRSGSGAPGLGGSIGRADGQGMSGIPVASNGAAALYSSTGSAPPAMGASHGMGSQFSHQGPPAGSHFQQQPQQAMHHGPPMQQQPSQQGPPPSHTVLYPWSQRPLALLPSQLLPPASANAPSSPNLAAEPLLGPVSPLPFPRYGHSVNPLAAAASASGDLYIFGGLVQNTVKNDLYVVHCAGGAPGGAGPNGAAGPNAPLQVALLETRGEVPGPRVGHASVSVGNVLIVWGGDTKTRPEERQDDGLYLLNLSTREWTRVKTLGRAPEGRYGHSAAMVGSRFFVFGGQTDDGGFRNDLAWFDLQKLKQGQPRWSFVEYAPGQVVPPPRTGHTCVTSGDSLYIFGGTDGSYHYNDTWQYDLATGIWTELACIGYIPVPREGHAATLVDDVMYVFGGRGVDGKDLEDLAAFRISNHRWFMFQNMGPAPSGRSGHAMATWQTKVLVLGGESYTSQRADDPSIVHVLDTTKIKYPPDSSRPAQQPSQQSAPALSGIPAPGSLGASSGSQRKSSIPVAGDLRERAASPTGSQRGLKTSLTGTAGQIVGAAAANGAGRSGIPTFGGGPSSPTGGSKIAKRATTSSAPTRPSRPDDAEAFTAGTIPAPGSLSGAGKKGASPTQTLGQMEVEPQPVEEAPLERESPQMASFGAAAAVAEASAPAPAPADAFYAPRAAPPAPVAAQTQVDTSALEARDKRIAELERRERWMAAALQGAREKGYVAEPSADGEGSEELEDLAKQEGEEDAEKKRMREVLVRMKGELARAKTLFADQAASLDERFQGAERSRTAALQEAAYYRAKLTAFETASSADLAKLERERTAELEQKLSAALSSRSELEAQVAKLEQDAAHHATLHSTAEEQHKAVSSRADAAEQSHARALADFADLQKRSHGHERTIAEHVEQLASLRSAHAQAEADNKRYREQVAQHEGSVKGWLATLEGSHGALGAAQQRNDELAASLDKAAAELAQQQVRVAELEQQVATLQHERDAAVSRADDLDGQLKTAREAHDKAHGLATGGLAELLAAHKERQALRAVNKSRSRSVDGDEAEGADDGELDDDPLPEHHAARVRAIEDEVSTVKSLHASSQSKADQLAADLTAAREREMDLHTQLASLRQQLVTVQEQHGAAVQELGTHKAQGVEREHGLKAATRARDAAEVKAGLLRALLADHGLAAPSEEELDKRFAPLQGDESADDLARRVHELEARAEQHTRQREQLEQRAAAAEGEAERARDEVERARQASRAEEGEGRERENKAREELEGLQSRHAQLEATHLKAVQYVKGTEKMLRRMKEELTRYKERCEELESPERAAELDSLRQQAESSTRQHDELQQRMEQLQGEYQRTLRDQQLEAQQKVDELSTELGRLDQELEKAQNELEETLTVNASLNKELQAALKNPSATRSGSAAGGEDTSRLQAELEQAQNKAEWLKRENASLEQRCRTAESKIAILLDHMEGVQDGYGSQQGSPHLQQGGDGAFSASASGSPGGLAHEHQWERRESVSDGASDYDEEPRRR